MRHVTYNICTLEPCTSLFPHQTLHITAMWPLFSRAYLACKGLCSLCLVAYLGLPGATPSLSSSALPECRVFSSKQRMQSLAETYAGGLLGSSLPCRFPGPARQCGCCSMPPHLGSSARIFFLPGLTPCACAAVAIQHCGLATHSFWQVVVGCCYQPIVAEQLMALADAEPWAPTLAVPWAVPETVPLAVP